MTSATRSAVSTAWPMPSGPVRKPEIERPGRNGSAVVSAPKNASTRLPAGSANTIRSFTRRSSASGRARRPAPPPGPGAPDPRRPRVEPRRIGDLPAIEGRALAAVLGNDDALLAIVHAERERGTAVVDELHAEKLAAIGGPVLEAPGP